MHIKDNFILYIHICKYLEARKSTRMTKKDYFVGFGGFITGADRERRDRFLNTFTIYGPRYLCCRLRTPGGEILLSLSW